MPRLSPPTWRHGAALALALLSLASHAADLTVSAASSLTQAFKDMAPAFEAQHPGTRVLLNFGASDALLTQIARGAPVDVFASADTDTMDRAAQQKLLVAGTRQAFAGNRLVVITPREGGQALSALTDLQRPGVRRVALGRPEGVPAGRYAKVALDAAGLWKGLEPKAVFAQNVRQALDYVARGEADAGFVYATDAATQKDNVQVAFGVPTDPPIRYPLAAVAGSPHPDVARQFIAFVRSSAGQAVLARHGFLPP